MNNRIVVGIGGTQSGDQALEWAVDYAQARKVGVELVHVVDDRWAVLTRSLTGTALLEAEHELRSMADHATQSHPGTLVHPTVKEGSPVECLVEEAGDAGLLVLGTDPLERFGSTVFSTRATHIAAAASCSVVVVPNGRPLSGTGVVVAIDGSASSLEALSFGAAEADRLGESLTLVYAWLPLIPWFSGGQAPEPGEPREDDRAVMAVAVQKVAERYPHLEVVPVLSAEPAAIAVFDAATGARLLVMGTHGRHGFAKVWMGSLTHEMILAMPCPVAVIRPTH